MLSLRSFRPYYLFLSATLLILSVSCTGCASKYPELKAALVWEEIASCDNAGLYCGDTGETSIFPYTKSLGERLSIFHFDAGGRLAEELELSSIPVRHRANGYLLTRYGLAILDQADTTPSSASGWGHYYLDSVIKMVGWDGKAVWETPGPANARFFQVDDSVIGCRGEDPAVLGKLPPLESMSTDEFEKVVKRQYDESPDLVMLLDTATGAVKGAFGIPNGLTLSFDGVHTDADGRISVEAVEKTEEALSRLVSLDAADGSDVFSIDLRKAPPKTRWATLWNREAAAVGSDNTISLLTRDGNALWTKAPKGARDNQSVSLTVLAAYDSDLLTVETNLGGPRCTPRIEVTVFDKDGRTVFAKTDLRQGLVKKSQSAPRLFAVENGMTTKTDYLYAFDFDAKTVKASRAKISSLDTMAVSASGKYVVTLKKMGDDKCKISMYRIGE